jgi:hypothetical protein
MFMQCTIEVVICQLMKRLVCVAGVIFSYGLIEEIIMMFFSDVFYWMETNHPIVNMITNHLAILSDCPVDTIHSIIRRHTAKFSTAA